MARGDYFEVLVGIPGGGQQDFKVLARTAGSTVESTVAREWVTIEELNQAKKVVRTAKFATASVICIVEGQDPPLTRKLAKK